MTERPPVFHLAWHRRHIARCDSFLIYVLVPTWLGAFNGSMELQRGRDAAIQLRAVVKAKLGPRTERLVHFDMTPIRKRTRKKEEKPPDGEEPVVKAASPPVIPN